MDGSVYFWIMAIIFFSGFSSWVTYVLATTKSEFNGGNYVPRKWETRDQEKGTWAIIEYSPSDRRYPFAWMAGWKDRVKVESGRATTFESAKQTIKNILK